MEKELSDLALVPVNRSAAVAPSPSMRQLEERSHVDGAATLCPDPSNDATLSRAQQWSADGRQKNSALGTLFHLPPEIRHSIWEKLLVPAWEQADGDDFWYWARNERDGHVLRSYYDNIVVTLKQVSTQVRAEVENLVFKRTVFRFGSGREYTKWLNQLTPEQILDVAHVQISMSGCDQIWHFGSCRRICVRPDTETDTDGTFSSETCDVCQWIALFAAGTLPPNLKTLVFEFDHDHGQESHEYFFQLQLSSEGYSTTPVLGRPKKDGPKFRQLVAEGAKGWRYDMMLLEILSKQAARVVPGVTIMVDESYHGCAKCHGEVERILAEIDN
ncbi:MAG: hypothetical protein Q9202_007132 [Teloschistes flavicans]